MVRLYMNRVTGGEPVIVARQLGRFGVIPATSLKVGETVDLGPDLIALVSAEVTRKEFDDLAGPPAGRLAGMRFYAVTLLGSEPVTATAGIGAAVSATAVKRARRSAHTAHITGASLFVNSPIALKPVA